MAARGQRKRPTRKRRSTRKKQKEPILNQIGTFLLRYEVAGVMLILIAVLTLLSLITDSRGSVTSAWIGALDNLVGIGIWGIPFATGALGLWLVVFAIDQFDNLAWERPAGLVLILLAFITGASLSQIASVNSASGQEPVDGGLIGNLLAEGLYGAIGLGGAWAIVTLLMMVGIVLLGDQLIREQAVRFWDWYGAWQEKRRLSLPPFPEQQPLFRNEAGPQSSSAAGDLPILNQPGRVARWRKYLDWSNLFSTDPSSQPDPTAQNESPQPQRQTAQKQTAGSQTVSQASVGGRAPARRNEAVPKAPMPARIIGETSEWQPQQLPRLENVLLSWDRVVDNDDLIRLQGAKIQETLALFGVPVSFEGVNQGPTVTQYLIRPGYEERVVKGEIKRTKVKVSKIANLSNDLALALAASSVRIEAPVPGTSYVGVEVPNQTTNVVGLRELMESEAFEQQKGKLKIALGEDVKGNAIITDLARMPHLLIAGATGSGKSSCINSIIACLLCTHTTESLRMLMIDPKMVELSIYNRVPHLLSPVVTEVDKAAAVLYWAVKEMERRYQLCSQANARDLERFNAYLLRRGEKPLPFIVIIVDEMADLMMAAPEEVEKHICRLAQMARAVGIHLIIATQRPSVDVITGLIKANFPSRIAFAVTSQTDSRVILDTPGAERLLGRGDMLFMGADGTKLERMQGTYVSDDEINNVVRYWKGVRVVEQESPQVLEGSGPEKESKGGASQTPTSSKKSVISASARERPPLSTPSSSQLDLRRNDPAESTSGRISYGAPEEQPSLFEEVEQMKVQESRDEFFERAVEIVKEEGRGSTNLLQRKLKIGYPRASRLVEQLEEAGVLGPAEEGTQGRPLLLDEFVEKESNFQESQAQKPHIIGQDEDENGSEHQFWF